MSTDPMTGQYRAVDDAFADLPPRVAALADEYERLVGDRDRFLWQWIHSLLPSFTLSSVDDRHASRVRACKTTLTMYVTLLDDLLERHGDRRTFREACRLAEPGASADPARAAVDAETFAFIERVWATVADDLEAAPRGDEFADVFAYDLRQTANAIEYSALVSERPHLANLSGARRFEAHNMNLFAYVDVDLMYSSAFDPEDLGSLRDLCWDLQEMARIGNWLTTWERELAEGDYSAGVVVLAIQEGLVSAGEMRSAADPEAIAERIRANDVEDHFRRRWARLYREARSRNNCVDSVDVDRLVDGMETVYEYHLASEGLK